MEATKINIKDCLMQPRPCEPPFFDVSKNHVSINLSGYAIIPMEDYNYLVASKIASDLDHV